MEVTALVKDETEDPDQNVYQVETEERPEIRVQYGKMMDFVDIVDQLVASALSPNRKRDWSQSYKLWEIIMLIIVNAMKLYESNTGDLTMSTSDWVTQVKLTLAGMTLKKEDHPIANQWTEGRKLRC